MNTTTAYNPLLEMESLFLQSNGKLLLDLIPEKNPETGKYEVNLHEKNGNFITDTQFGKEEQAEKFIEHLTCVALAQELHKLAAASKIASAQGSLYLISDKGSSKHGAFGNQDPEQIVLELEPVPGDHEADLITVRFEELSFCTLTENKFSIPTEGEKLEIQFHDLCPAKIPPTQ